MEGALRHSMCRVCPGMRCLAGWSDGRGFDGICRVVYAGIYRSMMSLVLGVCHCVSSDSNLNVLWSDIEWFADVQCSWLLVSAVFVVLAGGYLAYLCSSVLDTGSMAVGIPRVVLGVSVVHEHR